MLGRYVASTVLLVSTQTFRRADSVGGQLRGDKECPSVAYVTSCGRVWRKVPEGDAGIEDENISDGGAYLLITESALCPQAATRDHTCKV